MLFSAEDEGFLLEHHTPLTAVVDVLFTRLLVEVLGPRRDVVHQALQRVLGHQVQRHLVLVAHDFEEVLGRGTPRVGIGGTPDVNLVGLVLYYDILGEPCRVSNVVDAQVLDLFR